MLNVRKRILFPLQKTYEAKSRQELFNIVRIRLEEDIVLGQQQPPKSKSLQSLSPPRSIKNSKTSKLTLTIDMDPKNEEISQEDKPPFAIPAAIEPPAKAVEKQVDIDMKPLDAPSQIARSPFTNKPWGLRPTNRQNGLFIQQFNIVNQRNQMGVGYNIQKKLPNWIRVMVMVGEEPKEPD